MVLCYDAYTETVNKNQMDEAKLDNNKIASIMSKTHNAEQRREENLCVHVLNQLLDKNQNNKIAQTQ